ncbi:MAG TPA: hypothetical protein VGK20_19280 [Candidatus Binatia bacterium]|jgi:hypothetical protein
MLHRRSKTESRMIAALLVAALVVVPSARAVAQTCDPNTEARLKFLESRLDEGKRAMDWWWGSWMSVFSIGVGYETYKAITQHDDGRQAAAGFQAGKSAVGIAQLLLRPHAAIYGSAPMRSISKATPQGCAERLALAEKTLREQAQISHMRYSWKQHLTSLTLNLGVGLGVAYGFGERKIGWRDFGISEVSAEAHIWTHPTRAISDWDDYQSQFDGRPAAMDPPEFHLAAVPGGIGFEYVF